MQIWSSIQTQNSGISKESDKKPIYYYQVSPTLRYLINEYTRLTIQCFALSFDKS